MPLGFKQKFTEWGFNILSFIYIYIHSNKNKNQNLQSRPKPETPHKARVLTSIKNNESSTQVNQNHEGFAGHGNQPTNVP